jgi:hypothetical protein
MVQEPFNVTVAVLAAGIESLGSPRPDTWPITSS